MLLSTREMARSPPSAVLSSMGVDATSETIIVYDKLPKRTSASLFLTLRRRRSVQLAFTLWADALCITYTARLRRVIKFSY
jgi:hypothetical protein